MKQIRRDWTDFLFTLRPATPLALYRIAFGLVMIDWCVLMAPELKTWFSQDGFYTLEAMRTWESYQVGFDVLALQTWCHSTFGVWLFGDVTDFRITVAVFVVLCLSAICVTIGYKTRLSSIVLWLLMVSFQHRDSLILNGGDGMLRNMAFLMMFANSGAAISVDRLMRIGRGVEHADVVPMIEPWALRLLQLQLATVYLVTVGSKLTGDQWRDGTALYYALHLTDLHRFSMFGLQDHLEFTYAMSYATLFAEFCLGTFIWLPRARPYVIAMGVALHLGIEYAMNIPLFAYTMISSYVTFVRTSWVDSVTDWAKSRLDRYSVFIPNAPLPGYCGALLQAMDAFQLVRLSADTAVAIDSGLTNRVMWRLPAIWAVAATPLLIALSVWPSPIALVLTGILWPVVIVAIVSALSRAVTGWIANSAPLAEPERLPVRRRPKRSTTQAH